MDQSAVASRPQPARVLRRSLGLAGLVLGAGILLGAGHAQAAETGPSAAERTLGGLAQTVQATVHRTLPDLVPSRVPDLTPDLGQTPEDHPATGHPATDRPATRPSRPRLAVPRHREQHRPQQWQTRSSPSRDAQGGAAWVASPRPAQRCNYASPVTRSCIVDATLGVSATAVPPLPGVHWPAINLGLPSLTLDLPSLTLDLPGLKVDLQRVLASPLTSIGAAPRARPGPSGDLGRATQPSPPSRPAPQPTATPASYRPAGPVEAVGITVDERTSSGRMTTSGPAGPAPYSPLPERDLLPSTAGSVSISTLQAATSGAFLMLGGLGHGRRLRRQRIRVPRSRVLRPTPSPA